MKKTTSKKRKTSKSSGQQKIKLFSYGFLFFTLGCLLFAVIGGISAYTKSHSFCANSISCISDLSGKVSQTTEGTFMGQKVQAPNESYFAFAETKNPNPAVLGTTTAPDSKHIYVDLSQQRLYAFDGNTLVYNFLVSTGKWHPTPTGTFRIWIKLQATRMAGGSGADAYDLPNVPWTMFFANDQVSRADGFSLHGAYWHNNFGHPMSHGCVNISPANAKLLFDWANPATQGYTTYTSDANPGTLVTIYGTAPQE